MGAVVGDSQVPGDAARPLILAPLAAYQLRIAAASLRVGSGKVVGLAGAGSVTSAIVEVGLASRIGAGEAICRNDPAQFRGEAFRRIPDRGENSLNQRVPMTIVLHLPDRTGGREGPALAFALRCQHVSRMGEPNFPRVAVDHSIPSRRRRTCPCERDSSEGGMQRLECGVSRGDREGGYPMLAARVTGDHYFAPAPSGVCPAPPSTKVGPAR